MKTAELPRSLLPPVSYDLTGTALSVQTDADAAALDEALASVAQLEQMLFPDNPGGLLAEWEHTYGLPDSCISRDASTSWRVAILLARYIGVGGLSRRYFIQMAASMGFVIDITELDGATCVDPCDSMIGGDDWRFVWEVRSSDAVPIWYAGCQDTCTDPLTDFGDRALECLLYKLAPSGTLPVFAYGEIP